MSALSIYNALLFLGTFGISLYIILVFEASGFWLERVINKVFRSANATKKDDIGIEWELRVILGALVYGMLNFWIGLARIAYSETIFYTSLGIVIFTGLLRIYLSRKHISILRINLLTNLIKASLRKYWLTYTGVGLVYLFCLNILLRPVTQFDGVWYHIPIPKFFLQEGNIDYRGPVLRYWVHPFINFFWNMLPLSVPNLSLPAKSIVINFYTFNFSLIGVVYAIKVFGRQFDLAWPLKLFGPFLLFITSQSIFAVGFGYNDLFTVGIASALAAYIFKCMKYSSITSRDLTVIFLLCIQLFLLKIFFGVFAFVIGLFLLYYCFVQIKEVPLKRKLVGFICPLVITLLVFVLPWLIRSKLQTGRWLDPIGAPGINEDAYNFAGSMTAENHWGRFVLNRFYDNFIKIFVELYSPVFVIGSLAILSSRFRSKYGELWAAGFVGFWTVYFMSIVTEWRYFFPSVAFLCVFGLIILNQFWLDGKKFLSGLLILGSIGFGWYTLQRHTWEKSELYRDMYLQKGVYMDTFLSERLGLFTPSYYPSQTAPKPVDLRDKEKIYVANIIHTAYISNPILTYHTHDQLFKRVENVEDFVGVLKNSQVRYILSREKNMPLACRQAGVKQAELCTDEDNQYWKVAAIDQRQNSIWYQLK